MGKISVGILGFGKLGQYLVHEILQGELQRTHELAFVWNRTRKKVDAAVSDGLIQASQVLPDLAGLCKKILRHPELKLPNLIVEVEAFAPRGEDKTGEPYHLKFERHNPAVPGAVTGNLTYHSFLQSLQKAHGHLEGVHFC